MKKEIRKKKDFKFCPKCRNLLIAFIRYRVKYTHGHNSPYMKNFKIIEFKCKNKKYPCFNKKLDYSLIPEKYYTKKIILKVSFNLK